MNPTSRLWAAAAVATLAACQTRPVTNPDLDSARSAVEQARANPYAARSATVELDRAQQALQRADAAWTSNHDTEETRHLAYMARRRAEIAMAVAAQAQADERVKQAGTERDRARLESRTQEAAAAAAAASAAQASARNAQGQARASRQDAQQSREEAEAARQQAAQSAQRASTLERDLQALQGRNTQRGMVITMGDVLFATGQAQLAPGARRNVERLADVLKQYPERRVLIEGYTDNTGSDELNMDLSRRRAETFKQALQDAGVSPERMEVRAHGKDLPVASNSSAAGRQQNRRVEVLFSDPTGRFAGG